MTVYVDDVTLSGETEQAVLSGVQELETAAADSNFAFNEAKKQGPCDEVTAFNIRFGSGTFEIEEARMDAFKRAIEVGSDWSIDGILGYVGAVNQDQFEALVAGTGN